MKLTALLVLSAASMLRFCGGSNDAPPPEPVTAEPPAAAAPPLSAEVTTAKHGGSVVVADDHAIEIVARADGDLQAFVRSGAGTAPAPEQTTLTLKVRGPDGQPRDVAMSWDVPTASFRGRLTPVPPSLAAVDVVLMIDGRTRLAQVPSLALLAAPGEPQHGGLVLMAGNHAVEVVALADGKVHAYLAGEIDAAQASAAQLTINVRGQDGAAHPVAMVWSAPDARFVGALEGVIPAPGPIELALTISGESVQATTQLAAIATAEVAAPSARVEVGVRAPAGHPVGWGAAPRIGAEVQGVQGAAVSAGARLRNAAAAASEAQVQAAGAARAAGSASVGVRVQAPRPPAVGVHVGGSLQVGH